MTLEANNPGAACPLCESAHTFQRPGYQDMPPGHWSLYVCSDCGTSFVFPMPDQTALNAAYNEDYYGCGQGKFAGPVEAVVCLFRYLRARSIRKLAPTGRVLDVGCGRGVMLKFLKTWGYQVDGIELDTIAASRAEKNLEQTVFHSLHEVAQSSPAPYDVICFWHSLEHMRQPGTVLKLADKLLAPGGVLVIAAPHMGSIQSRMSRRSWLHLDLPRHLAHFDMDRLAAFLQKKGYVCLRHTHFSQEYNVIDTLCYFFQILGFGPLYPFDLMKNTAAAKTRTDIPMLRRVAGVVLMAPLTVFALLVSNIFSMTARGSTSTLVLRRRSHGPCHANVLPCCLNPDVAKAEGVNIQSGSIDLTGTTAPCYSDYNSILWAHIY